MLNYAYDAVSRVTSMNDYHNNVTSYTYTNLDQLDTITARKIGDYTKRSEEGAQTCLYPFFGLLRKSLQIN